MIAHIGPFPCPVPGRGNHRVGPNQRVNHWSGEARVAKEQRRIVAAAFAGSCSQCGASQRPVRLGKGRWLNAPTCGHRAPVAPIQLPPHGPEHDVDTMVVRVPRHRGSFLDAHDGLPQALKAIVDEVTEQLWPKGPDRKPIGQVDDSATWLRWSYGQRPPRKARKRPRPGDPPPDPPNKGTELVEIWIAPREDCPHCGRSMLPVRWERVQL